MFSINRSRMIAAVAGLTLAGGTLFAQQPLAQQPLAQQPNEGIRKFNQEQSLTRQKIEGEVITAIDESNKLKLTSEAKAIRLLKAKVDQIKDDPILNDADRQALTTRLKAQITAIENKEPVKAPANSDDLTKRRANDEARNKAILEEVKDVRLKLQTIQILSDKSEKDQAKKEAEALLKKYPNNPAVIALSQTTITADSISESKLIAAMMSDAWVKVLNDVSRSGIPATSDIQINVKYYKDVVAKRKGNILTVKERAIMKALDTDIIFSVKDKPLEEVLSEISESMKTPIILDELARQELKIDSNTFVTANLKSVTTRTALRKVLQDKGLAFVMKNESIFVTTAEKAKDMLVSRVYYVGDLVTGLGPFNSVRSGPLADQRQTQEMVDQLMRSILSVDPMSWEKNANGGHGTVSFHWPSMSFIIRNSAEVHAKLGDSFGGGK